MEHVWRGTVVGLGMAVMVLLPSTMASADCALDERPLELQVATAPVAFVGQVVDVRHDTTARFTVDEVWRGDVPAEVTVVGGPDEPGMATSVDRHWQVGTSYLVVPYVEGGDLHDNSCTATRPWAEDLVDARPAGAHAPTPVAADSRPGAPIGWFVALGGVLLAAVAVTVVLVRPGRDTT